MTVEAGQPNGATGEDTQSGSGSPSPDIAKLAGVVEALASQLGEIKQTQGQLREATELTRSKLQEKYDSLLTEANQLRQFRERVEKSGLDKLPDGTAVADVVAYKDQINAKLASDLERLQGEVSQMRQEKRRRDLEALVFADVAPEKRATAETLYRGILSKDGIDIEKTDNLDALASQIVGKINQHLHGISGGKVTPDSRARVEQFQDPNKVEWSSFKSPDDVPAHLWVHMPQAEFNRLHRNSSVSGGGGPRGLKI